MVRAFVRAPRALDWEHLNGRINLEKVYGFDISSEGLKERSNATTSHSFHISQVGGQVIFKCKNEEVSFDWGRDPLFVHLMLKMMLNAHSTLIMGLLDRYQGNVMTWVRPSNNKLIDRAARYILQLLKQQKKTTSYEEVVYKIFEEIEIQDERQPVVLKVLKRF